MNQKITFCGVVLFIRTESIYMPALRMGVLAHQTIYCDKQFYCITKSNVIDQIQYFNFYLFVYIILNTPSMSDCQGPIPEIPADQ